MSSVFVMVGITYKRRGKQSAAVAQEQNTEMIGNSLRAEGN
jgi:hypothetical protein